MRDLHGSESNPTPLELTDFEQSTVVPHYKVYSWIDNQWEEVPRADILQIDIDFRGSRIDGVTSTACDLRIDDSNDEYHPSDGVKRQHFSFRRLIKIYAGMSVDTDDDGKADTPYTWPWFNGFVTAASHEETAGVKVLKVRALDRTDILQRFAYGEGKYWGTTQNITLTGEAEYDLPASATGVFKVAKAGEEYLGWRYNWETNKILIRDTADTGTITVHYTQETLATDVLTDVLLDAGVIASAGEVTVTPSAKEIKRPYFTRGTTGLQAVEMLCQVLNYQFYFDGEGAPFFTEYPPVNTPVYTMPPKVMNRRKSGFDDFHLYNGVEVQGEQMTFPSVLGAEEQLGQASNSLDYNTVNRKHNFPFTGDYDNFRHEVDVANTSGFRSSHNLTTNGIEVEVSHDPARNLSPTTVEIESDTQTASDGSTHTLPFGANHYGNVRWEADFTDTLGSETKLLDSTTNFTGRGTGESAQSRTWADNRGQYRFSISKPSNEPARELAHSFTYTTGGQGTHVKYDTMLEETDAVWTGHTGYAYPTGTGKEDITIHSVETWVEGDKIRMRTEYTNATVGSKQIHAGARAIQAASSFDLRIVGTTMSGVSYRLIKENSRNWTNNFTLTVWGRELRKNVRVSRTYATSNETRFQVRMDYGSLPITFRCFGQQMIARSYTVRAYGKKVHAEKERNVYSYKTLTPEDIAHTGGPSVLVIRNHLIQEQAEADALAQSLLDYYSQIGSRMELESISPPPVEIGDTITLG